MTIQYLGEENIPYIRVIPFFKMLWLRKFDFNCHLNLYRTWIRQIFGAINKYTDKKTKYLLSALINSQWKDSWRIFYKMGCISATAVMWFMDEVFLYLRRNSKTWRRVCELNLWAIVNCYICNTVLNHFCSQTIHVLV